ncbi:lamin tail domain-containing protein [Eubacteriaceae bacterium ES2]|nr:lamin tail domain-containing protein [Eubacteriaceae bacterium ES2]
MKKNKATYKRIAFKRLFVLILIALTLVSTTACDLSALGNRSEFDGYTLIEVDGGDLSGDRESNVVVDIGYGDREYYAFTNEYGQLVKVIADKIILQDDDNEPVLSTGRYYSDEAKVPGVESPTLDEGHVIADSLGGVSNAYNITPQDSTLNRDGDQAYMEKVIRDAGGCTDFTAVIAYPSTTTQIPSHYSFTYTLKGQVINDEFDNVNPDEVNNELNNSITDEATYSGVVISELDKKAEYIILKNTSADSVDLTGWKIVSVLGDQTFTFPAYSLASGASVKIGDAANNSGIDFYWLDGGGTWNNSKSDPAELYDVNGQLVDRYKN